jgi:transcriptional regulator with XRE-family HTH domain
MKRYSYGERDYRFGQAQHRLRTRTGLTQAGLAKLLGVSRRAVVEWEAGSNYPTAGHLQHFLELCVQQRVFAPGREEEEIRALWQAARQKVLLYDTWLTALLGRRRPSLTLLHPEPQEAPRPGDLPSAQSTPAPQLDWGEALDVPSFYGREQELVTLTQWVVEERCRVVSVLGLGGIGKSALTVTLMRQVAEHFQVVLFRSLRDAPSCEALLENCLQVLAPQPVEVGAANLERGLSLLLECLREQRVPASEHHDHVLGRRWR